MDVRDRRLVKDGAGEGVRTPVIFKQYNPDVTTWTGHLHQPRPKGSSDFCPYKPPPRCAAGYDPSNAATPSRSRGATSLPSPDRETVGKLNEFGRPKGEQGMSDRERQRSPLKTGSYPHKIQSYLPVFNSDDSGHTQPPPQPAKFIRLLPHKKKKDRFPVFPPTIRLYDVSDYLAFYYFAIRAFSRRQHH